MYVIVSTIDETVLYPDFRPSLPPLSYSRVGLQSVCLTCPFIIMYSESYEMDEHVDSSILAGLCSRTNCRERRPPTSFSVWNNERRQINYVTLGRVLIKNARGYLLRSTALNLRLAPSLSKRRNRNGCDISTAAFVYIRLVMLFPLCV